MDAVRKPCQGVGNIIRFNWHYYVLAGGAVAAILLLRSYLNYWLADLSGIIVLFIIASTFISLGVSFYIYDLSDLYELSWSKELRQKAYGQLINISAGFDETSLLLQSRYPDAELFIFDFYDPAKHTEVSIERARKAYASISGTQPFDTGHLPVQDASADTIFVILAAHEIRNNTERVIFSKDLRRVLKDDGQIVITEHLRDIPNFLAYNIGFFHFHSRATWLQTFHSAGLVVAKEIKMTPFITTFILEKNGTAY